MNTFAFVATRKESEGELFTPLSPTVQADDGLPTFFCKALIDARSSAVPTLCFDRLLYAHDEVHLHRYRWGFDADAKGT